MKNKPYKYSSKDRLEKTPNKKSKKKTEKVSENTVKLEEVKLKDSKSLDSSFLEARVEKKPEKNKKVKEPVVKDNSEMIEKIRTLRKIFLVLSLICIVLLLLLYSSDALKASLSGANQVTKTEEVVQKKGNEYVDSNYLFVGGYHTDSFPLEEFGLDYHYVKSGNSSLTTKDVLANMKDFIYNYNPSVVFLELGKGNLSKEEYLNDISTIIRLIKDNRPYAEIYIESIYPVSGNNVEARDMNQSLQRLSEENEVGYLDIYSMLIKNNELDKQYTDDGVHLNKNGYQVVYKSIQKVIG